MRGRMGGMRFGYFEPLLLAWCLVWLGIGIWRYRRFSLRTLLIATTLVAVVLGLVVWAVR
jgi:hypothetical protein